MLSVQHPAKTAMNARRRPNFFIVGAPRSGTTAMASYLGRHPGIFMPSMPDIYYFGSDLPWFVERRMTEEHYLSYFKDAREDQSIGDAARWYLYSKCAAAELRDFQPDARIIIMLRNPVDMMYSLHGHRLLLGAEDIADFGAALEAEPRRRATGDVPHHLGMRESVCYREVTRFAPQVERYFAAFGGERVHVIIFDDFVRDTAEAYRATLRFLGRDEGFQPEFPVVNAYRQVRSLSLTRRLIQPPACLLKLATGILGRSIQHTIFLRIMSMLAKQSHRPPMEPALRRRLTEEMRPDVERLGRIIGRDLSSWTWG